MQTGQDASSPKGEVDRYGRVAAGNGGRGAGVARWWKGATIALSILVVILLISVVILLRSPLTTMTKVEWSYYRVSGGPGVENNSTMIQGLHFCAPSDATSAGIFSMIWAASTGKSVQQVRIWTLLPPSATYPLGVPVILYQGLNESSGGTSFVSSYPFPCGNSWTLDVESEQLVTVSVIASLTYNVTVPSPSW
jgi:hypothetical protein